VVRSSTTSALASERYPQQPTPSGNISSQSPSFYLPAEVTNSTARLDSEYCNIAPQDPAYPYCR